MNNQRVKPGDLGEAVSSIIRQYTDEVVEALPEAVNAAAKKGLKILKSEAKAKIGGTKYTGSFKSKKTKSTSNETEYTLFSSRYRVAHLLEHGHVIKNQTGKAYGVTQAKPHWAPAEEAAAKELEDLIQKKVEEAG